MTDAFLEYNDVSKENMGYLVSLRSMFAFVGPPIERFAFFQNTGRIKLSDQQVVFKDSKTGKLDPQIQAADIKKIQWIRLGNKPGIKFNLNNGDIYRFGGFQETVSGCSLIQSEALFFDRVLLKAEAKVVDFE